MPVAMKRACLALLLVAVPVSAADRAYVVTDFDRVRVDGPFDVRVTTKGSPMARASGGLAATDALDIRVEGTTLIVRAGSRGWAALPRPGSTDAPVITLRTNALRGVTIIGGGKVAVTGPLRADRVDLQVTGAGSLVAPGLDADQVNATLLGEGSMTLGGRAGTARLTTSGAGVLTATRLVANDLVVRLDGTGNTTANARYTACVTTTGVGAAIVYGGAKCMVKAVAGGPISCGKGPPPAP
jgi:hypothetical protein